MWQPEVDETCTRIKGMVFGYVSSQDTSIDDRMALDNFEDGLRHGRVPKANEDTGDWDLTISVPPQRPHRFVA